jgi:hypothetical protein
MLQSTLYRGTHLAHNQTLIDRRKLHGKVRACAISPMNAKRLGGQPPVRDKPKDYPLADDSFWATDEGEDDPELDFVLIQGPSIAHPPRTARRPCPNSRAACRTAAAVGQARAHLSLSLLVAP